jgi:outer membrane protein assembly factor BamB
MPRCASPTVRLALALALCSAPVLAQDWPHYGGSPQRNGLVDRYGPQALDLLWSNAADPSIITWHPFLAEGRVITVREAGFPGAAANDAIVAYDLDSGAELWRTTLPYGGNPANQWIAWVGGVAQGRVIASRSDNGRQLPLEALDAATGAPLWTSDLATFAWAHDGLQFLDDGDVIVGDRQVLARLDGATGDTVWTLPRSCSVSGNCGAARHGNALYIDQVAPGGQVLTRVDADTGLALYSSPVMAGFTAQNQPFLAPDGQTVYFARSQNNAAVDALYAFHDDGSQLIELWQRPVRWTTRHEHGIGPDGSLYTFLPSGEFARLDPLTGGVLQVAAIPPEPAGNLSPQTAVDAAGRVYLCNGWTGTPANGGRLWGFGPELGAPLFTLVLDRPNAGGPTLGGQGQLVIADRTRVAAFRSPGPLAQCTPFFGGGLNPVTFQCVAPPALYGQWTCQVAPSAATALTLVLIAAAPAPVPLPLEGGELLLDLAGALPLLVQPVAAGGLHTVTIPGDPVLLGASLATQGARVDLPAGIPVLALGNGLDLLLGY